MQCISIGKLGVGEDGILIDVSLLFGSDENEAWLKETGWNSHTGRKKPRKRSTDERTVEANGRKSKIKAKHIFAHWKTRNGIGDPNRPLLLAKRR